MRHLPLLLAAVLLFVACAKQGYPTGGPKDVAPPKVVGCKPANEGRDFAARQFFIEFDEYVVLKNADANVLISPPMAQKPEFSTKGKGVLVRLKDTLQPQTTYLFQFKEAIADFNEGNVLPSFEYVFSTGSQMDTMMLAGKALRARDEKSWPEVLAVCAYRLPDADADTAATNPIADFLSGQKPSYVTRCDKDGNFAFHYIPAGRYRLLAVDDKNKNWLADSVEACGWDTAAHAALGSVDSSAMPLLRVSAPERRRQRLLKAEFSEAGHITISTLLPMQHPHLEGLNGTMRLSAKADTLRVWLTNEKADSATLVLHDEGLCDTLRLRYRPPRKSSRGAAAQAEPPAPLMRPLCDAKKAFYDSLQFAFSNPIVRCADSLWVEVFNLKDSTLQRMPLQLDSLGLSARVVGKLTSGIEYRMRVRDSLFFDLYGHPNDTLNFRLTPRDYGTFILHIENILPHPLVVELLDKSDTVLRSIPLQADGEVRFSHLEAGEYRLRAVVDADGSGSWTTGDLTLGRQPEEFVLFGKTLQLREKWEMEERWVVGRREVHRGADVPAKSLDVDVESLPKR